jgi:hypothetical protein
MRSSFSKEVKKVKAIHDERLINEVLFETQLGTLNRIATDYFAQNFHQNSGLQQSAAPVFFF